MSSDAAGRSFAHKNPQPGTLSKITHGGQHRKRKKPSWVDVALYQLPTPQQADKHVIIFLARLVTVVVRLYSLVRIILSLPSIVYIHNGNSYRYPTRYGSVSTIQHTATTTDRPTATKNINFCTTPSLFRETTVISTHNKNSIAVAHHG